MSFTMRTLIYGDIHCTQVLVYSEHQIISTANTCLCFATFNIIKHMCTYKVRKIVNFSSLVIVDLFSEMDKHHPQGGLCLKVINT